MANEERNVIVRVFGKSLSELNVEERRLWRCAAHLASYYRRYERNKAQQRKDASWRKVELLRVLGWEAVCMECSYDKYIGALDFHHINPHDKEGKVTTVEEAMKCRLLCANCHREAHRDMRLSRRPTGRPMTDLHPLVAAYLAAVGVVRPEHGLDAATRGITLTGPTDLDAMRGETWTDVPREHDRRITREQHAQPPIVVKPKQTKRVRTDDVPVFVVRDVRIGQEQEYRWTPNSGPTHADDVVRVQADDDVTDAQRHMDDDVEHAVTLTVAQRLHRLRLSLPKIVPDKPKAGESATMDVTGIEMKPGLTAGKTSTWLIAPKR